jgi:hypothetical protein
MLASGRRRPACPWTFCPELPLLEPRSHDISSSLNTAATVSRPAIHWSHYLLSSKIRTLLQLQQCHFEPPAGRQHVHTISLSWPTAGQLPDHLQLLRCTSIVISSFSVYLIRILLIHARRCRRARIRSWYDSEIRTGSGYSVQLQLVVGLLLLRFDGGEMIPLT